MAIRAQTYQARRLRENATEAERILWRALRELKWPFRVRRQHPIGRYIADFAIPAHRLVIEIDGGQHALAADRDAQRTHELNERGYRVIRFWNNDVLDNLEGVIQRVVAETEAPPPHPGPLRPKAPRFASAEGAERENRIALLSVFSVSLW